MKKTFNFATFFILSLLMIIGMGCSASNDQQKDNASENDEEQTDGSYPLTIENADREVTFEKSPERAVALYQQDAELFVELGLEDKLVGYSIIIEDTPAELKKKLADVPVLAENNYPSKEILLETDPDFLIGSVRTFTDNGAGTVEEFDKLGINSYITKFEEPETIENQVYKQIEEVARIFDVEERGEEYIQSMKDEIDEITEQVGDIDEPLKVFIMSGGESGSAQTSGGTSLDSQLIELAGGENIFKDVDKYLFEVSWEEVIDRNPDVIITSYCCGTTPDDLVNIISNNPVLADITAVKNEHFVSAAVEDTTGTVRVPQGIEKLAKGFYPERFK